MKHLIKCPVSCDGSIPSLYSNAEHTVCNQVTWCYLEKKKKGPGGQACLPQMLKLYPELAQASESPGDFLFLSELQSQALPSDGAH